MTSDDDSNADDSDFIPRQYVQNQNNVFFMYPEASERPQNLNKKVLYAYVEKFSSLSWACVRGQPKVLKSQLDTLSKNKNKKTQNIGYEEIQMIDQGYKEIVEPKNPNKLPCNTSPLQVNKC